MIFAFFSSKSKTKFQCVTQRATLSPARTFQGALKLQRNKRGAKILCSWTTNVNKKEYSREAAQHCSELNANVVM